MFKTANVGTTDRILRLVAGTALIAAPYVLANQSWTTGATGWIVQAVGAILAITAVVRFCPLYRIFGMRTCKAA